jgi:hypothetical protein
MNNKQGTEKDMQQRRWSSLSRAKKGEGQVADLPVNIQQTKPAKVDS